MRIFVAALCMVLLGLAAPVDGQRLPTDGVADFPGRSLPVARMFQARAGANFLYAVPAGRKALIVDVYTTNPTSVMIVNTPSVEIGGHLFRIGVDQYAEPGIVGRNYGSGGARFAPILLNPGERLAVTASVGGETFWAVVIEFDAASPLARADLRTWRAGRNILFTMPADRSIAPGSPGSGEVSVGATATAGLTYVNGGEDQRTLGGIYIVPRGETVSATYQVVGRNRIAPHGVFSRSVPGGLAGGDTMMLMVDTAGGEQFAWFNYRLLDRPRSRGPAQKPR
ncbi:hypothetical protein QH494_11895 [Sphingomonas sp. AR_OL41]|uniref:hypothetical protein n=1 Tax=Sphingomonas sp. AR_OL41 TaxID=3042729 RepID=UPI00248035E3|nr:hypothetical protein [Sphingomonas sp. AR_OL41]MDH7972889.1 hypothetical protein [Sphingomonas sp. AR_OL41]